MKQQLTKVTPISFHCFSFFFNDTATTEIYTLSLHDALPISCSSICFCRSPDRTSGLWLYMPASGPQIGIAHVTTPLTKIPPTPFCTCAPHGHLDRLIRARSSIDYTQ